MYDQEELLPGCKLFGRAKLLPGCEDAKGPVHNAELPDEGEGAVSRETPGWSLFGPPTQLVSTPAKSRR